MKKYYSSTKLGWIRNDIQKDSRQETSTIVEKMIATIQKEHPKAVLCSFEQSVSGESREKYLFTVVMEEEVFDEVKQ